MSKQFKVRQNRVSPWGSIERSDARGLFMGNRGDLHAPDGTFSGRQWRSRAWITCKLKYGEGRRVGFDVSGHYYPLFFLDEAVALSAGHRPCGHCRREDLARFKRVWAAVHKMGLREPLVRQIDDVLHLHRTGAKMCDIRHVSANELPDGVFVVAHAVGICISWGDALYPWSFHGYGTPISKGTVGTVETLTPHPIIALLGGGYRPLVHGSLASGATAFAV